MANLHFFVSLRPIRRVGKPARRRCRATPRCDRHAEPTPQRFPENFEDPTPADPEIPLGSHGIPRDPMGSSPPGDWERLAGASRGGLLKMQLAPGLHRVKTIDVAATLQAAADAGYATFVLPSGIGDASAFFDAVQAELPLDPPLLRIGGDSWDALCDSLWEGLYQHPSQRLAIVWPGTTAWARSHPEDFDEALGVLSDVAVQLADEALTVGRPKEVAVIVEQ
jgi:hypothetical protein